MNRETYLFHQTPEELCKELIKECPLVSGDTVLEPFKGEGNFYNNFPANVVKSWAELEQGRDYKDVQGNYDWVITNPPFRLETGTKRVNSFWFLLDYYSTRTNKGIAFLGNDSCFCTLTPRRITLLQERGWYIQKIVVCAVKKWRGRYFFFILQKIPNDLYKTLLTNY
jgi:DNA modification methylase